MRQFLFAVAFLVAPPVFAQDTMSFSDFQKEKYGEPAREQKYGLDLPYTYEPIVPDVPQTHLYTSPYTIPNIYQELDDETYLPEYQKRSKSR